MCHISDDLQNWESKLQTLSQNESYLTNSTNDHDVAGCHGSEEEFSPDFSDDEWQPLPFVCKPVSNKHKCQNVCKRRIRHAVIRQFKTYQHKLRVQYSDYLTKPTTVSYKCSEQDSIPFSSHPRSSIKLNSQIENQEQRLYELNNNIHTFDDSLKTLRHKCRRLALSGGDPNLIRSLDRVISDKIEQHAWKQKEWEQVRQKLKESKKRAGFTWVERTFLALSEDPVAPIWNVTNASTIAGASNTSEDELSSAVATTSNSINNVANEGTDAAENIPPIDLLWNSFAETNPANLPTPQSNVTAMATTAVSNSTESPAGVFYEADAKDLPIETPMSHILEDFLCAHNKKDVLQERLRQAEWNYTAEIDHLRTEQAAQDKSMIETKSLLHKERKLFQEELKRKVDLVNKTQTNNSTAPLSTNLTAPVNNLIANYDSLNETTKKASYWSLYPPTTMNFNASYFQKRD